MNEYFVQIHADKKGPVLPALTLLAENVRDAIVETRIIQRSLAHIGYKCWLELLCKYPNGQYKHVDWQYITG